MTATTTERRTDEREARLYGDPIAANVKVNAGALVVLDAAGNAKPGVTATGLVARGRAESTADNTGGNAGDLTVRSKSGCFAFGTDGTITRAHLNKTVYIVDDQTLSATDGSGTRSAAGTLKDLEGSGATAIAWTQIG